jgi:hypothetical protein
MLAQSSFGAYFFFGFSSLFCVGVCVLLMPETRGKSLESIDRSFTSHSTGLSLGRLRRRQRFNGTETNSASRDGNHRPDRPVVLAQ